MKSGKTTIDSAAVLAFIYGPRNRRRIIWSPSTTLEAMKIEFYPHHPPANYRKMKRVLEELYSQGHLVRRQRFHSQYSMKEVAYERVDEDHSGAADTKRYVTMQDMTAEDRKLDSIGEALSAWGGLFRLLCSKCDTEDHCDMKAGEYMGVMGHRRAARVFYERGWRYKCLPLCPRCAK
jgi:hypothetical protein